jgi:hypothetical protein
MPCIHKFKYDIRTGFDYNPKPNQDVLFVINEKNTIQEFKFIEEACGYFGLVYNFYDICLYGVLDILKPVIGKQTSLAQDFAGKTICILNS